MGKLSLQRGLFWGRRLEMLHSLGLSVEFYTIFLLNFMLLLWMVMLKLFVTTCFLHSLQTTLFNCLFYTVNLNHLQITKSLFSSFQTSSSSALCLPSVPVSMLLLHAGVAGSEGWVVLRGGEAGQGDFVWGTRSRETGELATLQKKRITSFLTVLI